MSSVDEELVACQKLLELGLYAEVSKRLRTCLGNNNEPRVAAALGEVLTFQGYWRDALQAFEQGLSCCTSHGSHELVRIQIEMQTCFLTPIITGLFTESLTRADILYGDFIARTDIEYLDENAVLC
jgi:hypothetical protein